MSLDLINHKETTSTVDANGVTWWNNPSLSVKISSDGKVFSKKKKKLVNTDSINKYAIVLKNKSGYYYNSYSFASIYSRVVLGLRLGLDTIVLKDESKGYCKENVKVVSSASKAANSKKIELNLDKNANVKITQEKIKDMRTKDKFNKCEGFNTPSTEQYYTHLQAKEEYITEDGGVFPSVQLAEWHQEKVSKGKGNAQVVLDFNGGWVLAEQIFLQEVVYRCDKPYEHFKNVMESNKGIISNVQKEEFVFDKVKGFSLPLHGLQHLEGLKCSKHQAEKINEKLSDFIDKYKSYVDSWDVLSKLVSPFK